MTPILDLLTRLRAATGPDRELDAEVAAAEAKANAPLRVMSEPVRAWCTKSPDGALIPGTVKTYRETSEQAAGRGERRQWRKMALLGWAVVPVDIVEVKNVPS